MELEVKPIEEKWGLFLGDTVLGTSKQRFDCDHGKAVLERWRAGSEPEEIKRCVE